MLFDKLLTALLQNHLFADYRERVVFTFQKSHQRRKLLRIDFCDKNGTKVQLTNVLIPSINDGKETLLELKKWLRGREIELLPFRKLCLEKYERLKIPFPYAHLQEATKEDIKRAYEQLY